MMAKMKELIAEEDGMGREKEEERGKFSTSHLPQYLEM